MKAKQIRAKFYIVVDKDGLFLRSKGYSGYGDSWVENINDGARIYTKQGPAKAQVTFWASNYPEYGVPNIVELEVVGSKIINQKNRIEENKKLSIDQDKKQKIKDAKEQLEIAKENLKKLEKYK